MYLFISKNSKLGTLFRIVGEGTCIGAVSGGLTESPSRVQSNSTGSYRDTNSQPLVLQTMGPGTIFNAVFFSTKMQVSFQLLELAFQLCWVLYNIYYIKMSSNNNFKRAIFEIWHETGRNCAATYLFYTMIFIKLITNITLQIPWSNILGTTNKNWGPLPSLQHPSHPFLFQLSILQLEVSILISFILKCLIIFSKTFIQVFI